ncbi:MAG: hypothetical protein HC933_00235 [Pleurocapsa sp. SU_196_0]|nr:hypothetical protein [Pleurocapsa sp. SU_196_0]
MDWSRSALPGGVTRIGLDVSHGGVHIGDLGIVGAHGERHSSAVDDGEGEQDEEEDS